jgi:Phosphotransferase enzyme family
VGQSAARYGEADPTLTTRRKRFGAVSSSLALLSNRQLSGLLDSATVLGTGIGGARVLLQVGDTPVFVKRVPLSDLEAQPEHVMSTANLFDLPLGCQYGVGGPSFGVWRELAANAMTTGWVLAARAETFPLMYHWRVLDGPASGPLADELADVERAVGYWHGSSAVRRRIEAFAASSRTVTLFLEYLPQTLPDWLDEQFAAGDRAIDNAVAMVEHGLRDDVALMNSGGLLHFDAHLGNIMTDGTRLYFVDFGLATSQRFDVSAAESDFLAANRTHDACHTITRFVDWLVSKLTDVPDWYGRDEYIAGVAEGTRAVEMPASAADVVRRYAPIAVIINAFYRQLHLEDRATPYPAIDVQRAIDRMG